jgi:uncharacterized protein (TIGR00730 family)
MRGVSPRAKDDIPFHEKPMNICVFTGSSLGRRDDYRLATVRLGAELASRGIGLVYGGASVGLMGVVADAALEAGGSVTGIMPKAIEDLEVAHHGLTELHIVSSMHERKAQMADLSDAFIVLPGGIGTLEEAFEVWNWSLLGIHAKPIGLLNVAGFFDGLENFLDHVVAEAFVKQLHRETLLSDQDPARLIDRLLALEMPNVPKWIALSQR